MAGVAARWTVPRRPTRPLLPIGAGLLAIAPAVVSGSVPAAAAMAPRLPALPAPVAAPTPSGAAPAQGAAPRSDPTLTGVFALTAGSCSGGGAATGSYFRMSQPGGGYISNSSSPCGDKTYTALAPGSDGGLSTAGYQPGTSRITQPQNFYGSAFTVSTNPTDPQTGDRVPVPSISDTGGSLSGNLSAFSVSWNGNNFNQGAPRPGASGAGPGGTYDSSTGAYTLTWTSTIQGGPFNGFTGEWHLAGTFRPASGSPASAATAPGVPSSATATMSSTTGGSAPQPGAAAPTGGLPSTGPTFPPWAGLAPLASGLALLVVARRRTEHAPRGPRPG